MNLLQRLRHRLLIRRIKRQTAKRPTITSEDMIAALKEIAIPKLREAGFKGSYPNFYREVADGTHVLCFDRGRWGGPSFYLELSRFPADFVRRDTSEVLPAKKLRSYMAAHTDQCRVVHDPDSPNPELWHHYGKHTVEGMANDVVTALPLIERFFGGDEGHERLHVFGVVRKGAS